MKFSTLLLATIVSAMPNYTSGQGKGNGEITGEEVYGGMNSEGGYEDYNGEESTRMESSKGSPSRGKRPHGSRRPHRGNNSQGNHASQGGNGSQGGNMSGGNMSGGNMSGGNMSGGNMSGGDNGSSEQGDSGSPNPSQSSGGDQGSASDQQKLDELNAIRAKVGAPPLQLSSKLTSAATKHSSDQASMGKMDHTGSDGSNPTQRINRAGIKGGATGENVAWNQNDWSAATQAWVKSPGHYRNMIDKNFKYVGFGNVNKYYTEDFSSTN